ncbi:unnamed protein product, partial [Iphiclides podalirius]
MHRFVLFCIVLFAHLANSEETEKELEEGRGKAKYALLIHFFYVVATKLFVLKIVYGAIFYVLLTKAWHFVIWLIHYMKEKKHSHEHHFEPDHGYHHDHHDHHDHHEYFDHQPYSGYGHSKSGYGNRAPSQPPHNQRHQIYDADGSYSVKT